MTKVIGVRFRTAGKIYYFSPGKFEIKQGTVHVGDNTHIGIGAVVKNNIDICSNCTIGAGTVVVENLFIEGTYVGTPAKIIA